jgi:hypothetical protein
VLRGSNHCSRDDCVRQLTPAVFLFRPLEGQQQQHVAPAGLNLTALAVLIEPFVFASGHICAVLMLSWHPTGRRLQQVFSQASGTGGFVDTMTSGSFNVSFLCGSLSTPCAAHLCCQTVCSNPTVSMHRSACNVLTAASAEQLISLCT